MWEKALANSIEHLASTTVTLAAVLIAAVFLTALILKVKTKDHQEFEIEDLTEKWRDQFESFADALCATEKERKVLRKSRKKEQKKEATRSPDRTVFVLDFKGDLSASQTKHLREEISLVLSQATAATDEIVLRLDSPGGTVTGYGLAASQLERIRTANIPLHVFVDQVAASGGYMMACLGTKIYAAPFAIIGSIGVLMQLPNLHRFLQKNSIDYKEYTAGEFKRTVSALAEITPQGEAKLHEQLEQTHLLFKEHVSSNRPQLVLAEVATGEYWFAKDALKLNLIDAIRTSDDYLQSLAKDSTKKVRIVQVKHQEKKSLQERLMGSAASVFEKAAHKIWQSQIARPLLPLLIIGSLLNPKDAYAQSNKNESHLRIGITQEFENLNPLVSSMLATSYIYGFVGRSLVTIDPHGNYQSQLAVNIPTLENKQAQFVGQGPNRKIHAQWELKPNASWGDGKPVTCHDIKFSWNAAKSDSVSIPERQTYTNVEDILIDATNPKKCTFIQAAKWDFNRLATFRIVPEHLEKSIFQKFGKQKEGYDRNTLYATKPTHPGLYNGPYVISEIKLGSHVSMTLNPHFYGKKPSISKITIKLIPNTGTLEANLRSQTIDMISVLGMSFDQALMFEKEVKKEKLPYSVNFKPSLVYEHINLNLNNEIFKDPQVRKALVYGINREDLTKALFEGKQIPALHNIAPSDPWYTNDPGKIVTYPFSRRKAKKMLDEAGWKEGPDGIRVKNGKRLEFLIMTTAGNKARELVLVYLKDQWKQIGVDAQIKTEQARTFFGETVRKGQYLGMAMYAWVSSPENSPRSVLHSESIPTKQNGFSGQNSMHYKNAQVDQLLEQLDLEFDSSKRLLLIHQVLKYYTDEIPVIPLYYRSDTSVTPHKLKGYQLSGHQFSDSNFSEEWVF